MVSGKLALWSLSSPTEPLITSFPGLPRFILLCVFTITRAEASLHIVVNAERVKMEEGREQRCPVERFLQRLLV